MANKRKGVRDASGKVVSQKITFDADLVAALDRVMPLYQYGELTEFARAIARAWLASKGELPSPAIPLDPDPDARRM